MGLGQRLLMASGGSGGFAPPASAVTSLTAAPQGGWSWFEDPRAVAYNGYTYFGYVRGDNGDVAVVSVSPVGGVSAETVLKAALEVDDHASPSFLVRDSDHKLMAFYSSHFDTTMRLRISSSPLGASTTWPSMVRRTCPSGTGVSSVAFRSGVRVMRSLR